jgi:O-antigen ligase
MGFGGLCMVLIAVNDPERRRRRFGVASGAFMVLASMGRLAAFNLVACLALRTYLCWTRRVQVLALSAAAMLALAVPTVSIVWLGSPLAFRERLEDDFNAMRPSATRSRDLVYEASWDGFYQAPLLGHGWPGEAVYPEDFPQVMQGGGTMVPGSHSTTIGLLYLGGIVTFAAFLFALARTIAIAVRSAPSPESRRDTIALLAAIGLTGLGEGIYSLVVPTLYAFLWVGVALGGASRAPAPDAAIAPNRRGIALPLPSAPLAPQPS